MSHPQVPRPYRVELSTNRWTLWLERNAHCKQMSQGEAARSTLAFFRVAHFMTRLLLNDPDLAPLSIGNLGYTYGSN